MKTEEEKLNKKLKINRIIIAILVIILIITILTVVIKLVNSKNGLNNNDSNMGFAAKEENTTFFYSYNEGLVKKEKKDRKVLIEDQAYSINCLNGNVYYTTPNSTGGINIKKINFDGKDEKVLLSTSSNSSKIYIHNSEIYYLTSNPDTISKMDLDGKNNKVILTRSVTDFKVVDEKIYFSDIMGFLYSVDLNGDNYKTIVKEAKFGKFQILDKYVYYFDKDSEKLMRIRLDDTSKKEEVSDKLDCDIYNVTSNGVYYYSKANSKISFVSLNGKKTKDIVNINTDNTKINIVDNVIYYIDNEAGKAVTKCIGTDGKQIK